MGVMFDYFVAPTDEAAAAVIDRIGGPGVPAPVILPPEPKRSLFRRRRPATASLEPAAQESPAYKTLSVKGIDPVVQLGTLEELLTGRSFDAVLADPRTGQDLASRDDGGLLVLTLNDELTSALIASDSESLERVAVPWSQTEEFWGSADPTDLAEFLKDLAELARNARTTGGRLYCWVCV